MTRHTRGGRWHGATALLAGGTLAATLTGCGGGGNSAGPTPVNSGTASGMVVLLHDTPNPNFQHINMTVAKVTAVDGSGMEQTLTSTPQTFDVLALQNGVSTTLATDPTLAPGTYSQIRIYVTAADAVDNVGTDHTLSGSAVGTNNYSAVPGTFTVSSTSGTSVSLDIDAAHSASNGLGYTFSPIIKMDTPANTQGSLHGTLLDSNGSVITNVTYPLGATLEVFQAGTSTTASIAPVAVTSPSATDGTFSVSGLPGRMI